MVKLIHKIIIILLFILSVCMLYSEKGYAHEDISQTTGEEVGSSAEISIDQDAEDYFKFSYSLKDLFSITKNVGVIDDIKRGADEVGVSETLLIQIAHKESNYNPKARSGNSSAKGLYQFIDATWNVIVDGAPAKYDLHRSDRYDAYKSTIACGLLIKDNENYLKHKLHRKVTNKELYLAHFAGQYGAYKMITCNQDQNVEEVLGTQVVTVNPQIAGKTVAEAIQIVTRGIDNE